MKTLVLCVCVLALASFSSASVKQQLKDAMEAESDDMKVCMEEHHMTSADWWKEEDIVENRHTESANEERSRKNGCVLECCLKKHNVMEGTDLIEANMYKQLDEEFSDPEARTAAHEIMGECMKEVKTITENCKKGLALYACYVKAIHDMSETVEQLETEGN